MRILYVQTGDTPDIRWPGLAMMEAEVHQWFETRWVVSSGMTEGYRQLPRRESEVLEILR